MHFQLRCKKDRKRRHTDGDLDGLALDDILAVLALQKI
jgi:hypothetical protein